MGTQRKKGSPERTEPTRRCMRAGPVKIWSQNDPGVTNEVNLLCSCVRKLLRTKMRRIEYVFIHYQNEEKRVMNLHP